MVHHTLSKAYKKIIIMFNNNTQIKDQIFYCNNNNQSGNTEYLHEKEFQGWEKVTSKNKKPMINFQYKI